MSVSQRYKDVDGQNNISNVNHNGASNEQRKKLFNTRSNTKFHSHLLAREEQRASNVIEQTARTALLLQEDHGFIENADGSSNISQLTQHEIRDAVDIASAQKFFELDLHQFGPYRINYTRNGRFLCLGGRKGHVAAIDWQTKRLMCEINVMEQTNDIRWLHQETMFAVAQKQWTYIYDNQGVELHCLKMLDSVLRLEFLPYHFLLVSANSCGYLTYLDVSVGQKVTGFNTHMGRLDVMCHNPANAIVCLGHSGGTVTMWSPNVNEPLVKMLCHGSGVRSVAVEKTGRFMVTSGIDRTLKIWDVRTYKLYNSYKIREGANSLSFSQTGYLAAGIGNVVEVYERITEQVINKPYLSHRLTSRVHSLQFCPYEDVLGVGHAGGFSSLIVPGTGEPNFDATESNPYQTKKQRREMEVRQLLEKIQPDMITLDTAKIGQLERKSAEEIMQNKEKEMSYHNQERVKFKPKHRTKGGNKPSKVQAKIQAHQEQHDRKLRKRKTAKLQRDAEKSKATQAQKDYNVLDRFQRRDV